MTSYFAFLSKNDDGSYTVEFPDLPGCVTVGDNPGMASAQAGDDLVRHLTACQNFGYPVPSPSSEAQLAEDAQRRGADLMAFEVDLELLSIANPMIYHTL